MSRSWHLEKTCEGKDADLCALSCSHDHPEVIEVGSPRDAGVTGSG